MPNTRSVLPQLFLLYTESERFILLSASWLPSDSSGMLRAAEGQVWRWLPVLLRGARVIWVLICLQSLPENRLHSWAQGHSFAGSSGRSCWRGSVDLSSLAARAAFGYCEKLPLLQPVIGGSLKYWLKNKMKLEKQELSLENEHFFFMVIKICSQEEWNSSDLCLSRCFIHLACSPTITSACSGVGMGTALLFVSPQDIDCCTTSSYSCSVYVFQWSGTPFNSGLRSRGG